MIGIDDGQHVTYLALGHPAWPGNLSFPTYEQAAEWFNEHRETYPVYIDRVETNRVRRISPGPEAPLHEYGYDVNDPQVVAVLEPRRQAVRAIMARNEAGVQERTDSEGSK